MSLCGTTRLDSRLLTAEEGRQYDACFQPLRGIPLEIGPATGSGRRPAETQNGRPARSCYDALLEPAAANPLPAVRNWWILLGFRRIWALRLWAEGQQRRTSADPFVRVTMRLRCRHRRRKRAKNNTRKIKVVTERALRRIELGFTDTATDWGFEDT